MKDQMKDNMKAKNLNCSGNYGTQGLKHISFGAARGQTMRALLKLVIMFYLILGFTVPAKALIVDNNDSDPVTGASGTVTDLDTGFIWQKDANCIKTHYPEFDLDLKPDTTAGAGDGQVIWQNAFNFVDGMNSGLYPACGMGYTDWRLPTGLKADGVTTCIGLGAVCIDTELGHLYWTDGIEWTPDGSLQSPFINLGDNYWTSEMLFSDLTYRIFFHFVDGTHWSGRVQFGIGDPLVMHTLAMRGPFILPVAGNDSASTDETTPVNINVSANDAPVPDGFPLDLASIEIIRQPASGAAVANADGTITYTPDFGAAGDYIFFYIIRDTDNLPSTLATVTVKVNPLNNPPVAADDAYSTNENTTLIIPAPGVLSNDTDSDGDPLTASKIIAPNNGTLTMNATSDGGFTYTPNTNWNGTDSFSYFSNDGISSSNTATVTINITPNAAPPGGGTVDNVSLTPTAAAIPVNAAQTMTVSAMNTTGQTLMAMKIEYLIPAGLNLTNLTSTPAAAKAQIDPAKGRIKLQWNNVAPGTLLNAAFDASSTRVGSYILTVRKIEYKDQNGNKVRGAGNDAAVSITASSGNPVNNLPVAADDTATTFEATAVNIDVVANDSDIDGDALTVTGVGLASNGIASVDSATNKVTYTPTANFNGTDSFTYTISDGNAGTATATVTVTVAVAINITVTVAPPGGGGTVDNVSLTPTAAAIPVNAAQTMTVSAMNTTGQTLLAMKIEYLIPAGLDLTNLTSNPAAVKAKIDPAKGRIKLQWNNVAPGDTLNASFDASSTRVGSYILTVRKIEYKDQNGNKVPGAGNDAAISVTP